MVACGTEQCSIHTKLQTGTSEAAASVCAVVEVSTECSSLTDRGAVLTNKATCWITPTPEIQLFTVNDKGIKQSA